MGTHLIKNPVIKIWSVKTKNLTFWLLLGLLFFQTQPVFAREMEPPAGTQSSPAVIGNQQPSGQADEMFTWPDPQPIMPYLVTEIDPTLCPGCTERTIYGVILHPLGYIFRVVHGQQQGDPRPGKDTNGYFIHQVQILTQAWPLFDYIEDMRFGSNLPPYMEGKPYIIDDRNSFGKITFLSKQNVVEKGMLLGSGADSENVVKLVQSAVERIPDDGLLTPDMVAPPPMDLNEPLFAATIEEIWVGHNDNYNKELSQIAGNTYGTNLWINLKKPVNRLAAAIMIEDSHTFLQYQWMDNPPVDTTMIFLNNVLNESDTYVDSHQYGQARKLKFFVWINGELVKEIPLDIHEST